MANYPYISPQMQPQYGGYQQMYQQPQQPSYSVRPVGSKEEALGAQVDFLGLGTIMPDLGHGVVYLKRFNSSTGSSEMAEFKLSQPEPPKPAPQYVTIEEFEAFKAEMAKKPTVRRKADDE